MDRPVTPAARTWARQGSGATPSRVSTREPERILPMSPCKDGSGRGLRVQRVPEVPVRSGHDLDWICADGVARQRRAPDGEAQYQQATSGAENLRAIVDRLRHPSQCVVLDGGSYRGRAAKKPA
jgi:hypothetical protein